MPISSRARVWTFILYPDSLPNNYIELIEEKILVPLVISPIHDKDVAEEGKGYNNTIYKKPHYHAMVMFTNVKSYKQVKELYQPLGVSHVDQVHSTQAMIRYFIHADHKDKSQYQKDDIKSFNGADIQSIFEKNDKEIYGNLADIIKLIDDNSIEEFSDLVKICLMPDYYNDYFELVCGKYHFFLLNYLKSVHFKNKN